MKKIIFNDVQMAYLRQYTFDQILPFKLLYRIDQFGERDSDYIILGFAENYSKHETLKTMEAIIETSVKDTIDRELDQCLLALQVPSYVGVIPYEMAQDFLPISLKKDKGYAYLMKASSHILIHKKQSEIIVVGDTKRCEQMIESVLKHSETRMSHREKYLASQAETCELYPDVLDSFSIPFGAYQTMVNESQKHIRQGDIFQVVLSNTSYLKMKQSPYELYKRQAHESQMTYQCFINLFDHQQNLLINSPELLVKSDQDYVYTRPIAGTRARKFDGRDQARQDELRHNEKENAEHLMLVDLGRNDLQKVSEPGSVTLSKYKEVKGYDHVFHMVSEVVAKRQYAHVLDPIRATFPAGTVSGAPKIMAMKIIDKLETQARGFYAGTTFVIDRAGQLESCINLRSLFIKSDCVRMQVGSGIVDDSTAVDEHKELINKMKGQALLIKSEVSA